MSRLGQSVGLVLAVASLGGCASTTFDSAWINPGADASDLQGKRVAAFVVLDNEGRRHTAEDVLARELVKKGVHAYPGYTLTRGAPTSDLDALQTALGQRNVQAAVVMRVVARRQAYRFVPGYLVGGPTNISQYTYPENYNWTYDWGSGYPVVNDLVWVETLVYSVPDGTPLWKTVSRTFAPIRVATVIKGLADNAANEMKKAGLF